jgi:fatty acid desaturase
LVEPWLLLVVYALAVSRLTGLIVADEITRPVRDGLLSRLDERRASHRSLATLISCSWCTGLWVSAVAAPVAWWWGEHPVFLIPAVALAFSQVTGMLSDVGRG